MAMMNSENMAQDLSPITFCDVVGSTNDEVRKLGQEGAEAGTALAAHAQTEGRGRRGHLWHSPAGGLYLSVLLRPQVSMQMLMGLPAACALGAVDALRSLGVGEAGIKWPNDIVIADQKLAGILVEAGYGEKGVFAVCGIGVNIAPQQEVRRAVLEEFDGFQRPLTPAFLSDHVEQVPDFEQLATTIRDDIVRRAKQWEQSMAGRTVAGPLATILDEYFDAMPAVGQVMDAVLPDGRSMATGVFAGMDVWGRAILVTQDGEEVTISAEQASLRRTASA